MTAVVLLTKQNLLSNLPSAPNACIERPSPTIVPKLNTVIGDMALAVIRDIAVLLVASSMTSSRTRPSRSSANISHCKFFLRSYFNTNGPEMGLVEVCIRICVTRSLWILTDQAAASRGWPVEGSVVSVCHSSTLRRLGDNHEMELVLVHS